MDIGDKNTLAKKFLTECLRWYDRPDMQECINRLIERPEMQDVYQILEIGDIQKFLDAAVWAAYPDYAEYSKLIKEARQKVKDINKSVTKLTSLIKLLQMKHVDLDGPIMSVRELLQIAEWKTLVIDDDLPDWAKEEMTYIEDQKVTLLGNQNGAAWSCAPTFPQLLKVWTEKMQSYNPQSKVPLINAAINRQHNLKQEYLRAFCFQLQRDGLDVGELKKAIVETANIVLDTAEVKEQDINVILKAT